MLFRRAATMRDSPPDVISVRQFSPMSTSAMSLGTISLVIPVKNRQSAKARLADALNPEQRQSLFQAMVCDVFSAVAQSALSRVLVVSRDAWAADLAERSGFSVLKEQANDGHTSAVVRGFTALSTDRSEDCVAAMTLPADIPCVTAGDINSLLERFADVFEERGALLVPAADFNGTNAAILSPPDLFTFRFGDNSFYPHRDACLRSGVTPLIVENANIALDVDTPQDLEVLNSVNTGENTRQWLSENVNETGQL